MRNISTDLFWVSVGLALLASNSAWAAERIEPLPQPLPEGTLLKSVDGTVTRLDSNDVWFFEVGRDVNETTPRIAMGTRLALLPSATLETLVTDVNDRQLPRYRLTAQVTQYRGTNFLWVSYYLPLSRLKDANEPATTERPAAPSDANAVTANLPGGDEMVIPEEIAERLRNRRAARGPQRPVPKRAGAETVPAPAMTRILADAVGFIESQQGSLMFVPDTLGRNVAKVRYELLPCRALEQAEQRLAASPNPIRLKVAGLVTQCKGKKYLLLQRVIRVYSYGNFGG